MENKTSFRFTETTINDIVYDCRVTRNDDTYQLERDGKTIAELQYKDALVQVSGEPLDEGELFVIRDMIDNTNVTPVTPELIVTCIPIRD